MIANTEKNVEGGLVPQDVLPSERAGGEGHLKKKKGRKKRR